MAINGLFEDVDVIRDWLKQDIDHHFNGILLHFLNFCDNIEVFELLLKDKRVNINETSKSGTPLYNACLGCYYEETILLLKYGAEVDYSIIYCLNSTKNYYDDDDDYCDKMEDILKLFKWHIKYLEENELPKYDVIEIWWLMNNIDIMDDIKINIINHLFIKN